MPGYIHKPGDVGVVSRSGTLTYEAVYQLTLLGHRAVHLRRASAATRLSAPATSTRSSCSTTIRDTRAVIMIGEIGGTAEEEAALYIKENFKKPVVAFIAGQTAPKGRRMGHAGAIISGGRGTRG